MKKAITLLLAVVSAMMSGAAERVIYDTAEIAAGKSAVRAVSNGKGLKASVRPGVIAGRKCAVFSASEMNPVVEKDRWTALGFAFEPPAVQPVGLRWELAVPKEMSVTVEIKHISDLKKGFWSSQRIGGTKTVKLQPGVQTLDVYWSDFGIHGAKIAEANGGVLCLGEPGELGVISFSLILPEETGSEGGTRVPFFDPEAVIRDNPVARPHDALLMSLNGYAAGKGFRSINEPVNPEDVTGAIRWRIEGEPGKRSWGTFGIGLFDMPEPGLAGFELDIDVPKEVSVGIETYTGFNRLKGFYSVNKAGKPKRVTLKPGRQKLLIDWAEYGVPAELRPRVNAVMLSMGGDGESLDVYGASMVYPTAAAAAARRTVEAGLLAERQKVMIQMLKVRHVDWSAPLAKLSAAEREPLIWDGVMLAAQREQLNYFRHWSPARAAALAAENAALIKDGARGSFSNMRSRAEALQAKIDAWVDSVLASLTPEQRKFTFDRETREFRDGRGEFYRMFGPFFFRGIYFRRPLLMWRKWDMRYLAALGFNGIRLPVYWKHIEPERGKIDEEYMEMLKAICAEAERYGFGVSFDLHWPYPDWYVAGNPDRPAPKPSPHNSYHWREPLIEVWREIGKRFVDVPNLVAFEVPTNETPIESEPEGLTKYPELMSRWNAFLRDKYQTREALERAWAGEESLLPEESWENDSIRPLGFRNPGRSAEEAYAESPRFYDHLRFSAQLQREVSGEILRAIRESIPDAQAVFQRTIGDSWDKSPVTVDYHSIMTCVDEEVLAGTHYNMGGIQARKAVTLAPAGYDSEQQMEGSQRAVRRHVELGGGFCPFAFHFLGGGGMLLADHAWHLKPDVAYLPEMAEWIRSHRPAPKRGFSVAVIVNSRLEASTGHRLGGVIEALEKRGCRVGVFESLRVLAQPSLLDGYKLAVTNSGYMDEELLNLLLRQFSGSVLLHGRLDRDALARTGESGLPGALAREGFLLKTPAIRCAQELSGKIDLCGEWDFSFVGKSSDAPAGPPAAFDKVEKMRVPGMWGETGMTGSLQYRIGDGWYSRDVTIPATWKGRALSLRIGAIDDVDWVFWNGKLIGHTSEAVPNYWMRARTYEIPSDGIKYGEPNRLSILVRNLRDDGGIWKTPVEIGGDASGEYCAAGKRCAVSCTGDTPLIDRASLASGAQILATLKLPGDSGEYAALIRQGKNFYFIGDDASGADGAALDTVLRAVRK